MPSQALIDPFGRVFRYLRLSVTEACNFRCGYCLPNGYRKAGSHDFLTVEEVGRLARAFAALGFRKIRLTGGEPSLRRDLAGLIAAVAESGVATVALTTNGWNLRERLSAWRAAGLTHLNLSLDRFSPSAFARVTGVDRYEEVRAGLERALAEPGLTTKLNAVLLADFTRHDFAEAAAFLRDRPITLRYIELMRTRDNADYFAAQHLSGDILRNWLLEAGWRALERSPDSGPAVDYVHPDHAGRFGLIAPYAPGFCSACNRLRVSARGRLMLCLFAAEGIDLRDLLAREDQRAALSTRLAAALSGKTDGHRLHANDPGLTRHFAEIGG